MVGLKWRACSSSILISNSWTMFMPGSEVQHKTLMQAGRKPDIISEDMMEHFGGSGRSYTAVPERIMMLLWRQMGRLNWHLNYYEVTQILREINNRLWSEAVIFMLGVSLHYLSYNQNSPHPQKIIIIENIKWFCNCLYAWLGKWSQDSACQVADGLISLRQKTSWNRYKVKD